MGVERVGLGASGCYHALRHRDALSHPPAQLVRIAALGTGHLPEGASAFTLQIPVESGRTWELTDVSTTASEVRQVAFRALQISLMGKPGASRHSCTK
jgi:hypothetical protein